MTFNTLKPSILAGAVAAAGALAFSGSALAMGTGGGSGPAGEYAANGSYATTSATEGECTVFRPREVPEGAPLILWGNGTGAPTTSYSQGLRHWASWGFVVAAANTTMAGSGEEMLDCIDAVRSASYGDSVDFSRIGTSGHSQGGGGAYIAGRDERITATAPMQPYPFEFGIGGRDPQNGPMLLMSGGADAIAPREPVQSRIFEGADTPVFWATLDGASHFEPSWSFGGFRGLSTAWWLYQLKGDQDAAGVFTGDCTACDAAGWTVERKNF